MIIEHVSSFMNVAILLGFVFLILPVLYFVFVKAYRFGLIPGMFRCLTKKLITFRQ